MSGREEARSTAGGAAKQPDLRRYYRHRLPEVQAEHSDFAITLLRGRGVEALRIDAVTESVEWADGEEEESDALRGGVVLRRPDPGDPGSLPIGRGHRVRLTVRWNGVLHKLWEMRAEAPERSFPEGTMTAELSDEMAAVNSTKRKRTYRKGKRKPKGWLPQDVVRDGAKRDGVDVGSLVRARKRVTSLKMEDASLLELAKKAYEGEAEETGRRFIFRMRDGRFEVVHYRRNPVSFVVGPGAYSASVTQQGTSRPVTAITGKARIGKGKRAKKRSHTSKHDAVVRRFGYVHVEKDYGRLDSVKELRERVQKSLAAALRVRHAASISMPLVPFIRKGDSVFVDLPKEGFPGKDAFAFVSSVRHSVSASSRVTDLEVVESDPYHKYREELEKKMREKKREKRKKKK